MVCIVTIKKEGGKYYGLPLMKPITPKANTTFFNRNGDTIVERQKEN